MGETRKPLRKNFTMHYLILGGSGFQGRNLIDRLVKSGDRIRVFDKNTLKSYVYGQNAGQVEYIQGDFNSEDQIQKAVKGVDVIFHLISTTLPKSSNENTLYDVKSNIIPTLQLLEAAYKSGVKKVVYFSSGGTVYGLQNTTPTPEDSLTQPICSYGIHKVTIENYLYLYYKMFGLDYSVMRISNPYGTYQKIGTGQGVIPLILNKVMKGEAIEIWGDGTVIRDYIYVDDVVDAALLLSSHQGDQKIFNVGSGVGLSLNNLIAKIAAKLNRKSYVKYLPSRATDLPVSVLDITRARVELKWEPKVTLDEGISKMIQQDIGDTR